MQTVNKVPKDHEAQKTFIINELQRMFEVCSLCGNGKQMIYELLTALEEEWQPQSKKN